MRRFGILGLALFVSYAYFYQAGGWNQNSRFDLVRAIVGQRTLRIDTFHDNTGDRAFYRDHWYSDKAPGLALSAVPIVEVASRALRAIGVAPESERGVSTLSYLATIATSGIAAAAAATCLGLTAAWLFRSASVGMFVAISFGLSSPAWAYATLFMGHALATGCLTFAFCGALVLPAFADSRGRAGVACLIGLSAGWATVTDLTAAIPSALIASFALWQIRSEGVDRLRLVGLGVLAGALACFAVLATYNTMAFGAPFHIGYASEAGFPELKTGFFGITYPKRHVMYDLLFRQFRGLLPVAPVLALAPFGWWSWHRMRLDRGPLVVAILIPIYYLLLNSSYADWDGGWSYGPRHMVPALPFLALALAPLWVRAPKLARAGMAALCAVGVALTLIGVSVTPQPPYTYGRPLAELWWPAFQDGDLSVNHTSFNMFGWNPDLVRHHPEAHKAWNLGERLGLHGRTSLIPLLAAWALAAAVSEKGPRRGPRREGMATPKLANVS